MLTLEQIKNKIQNDLNVLAVDMGFVDDDGHPTIAFFGEVSTYADYSWVKAVQVSLESEDLKYLPITPFALIRENSTPSSGELLNERVDQYTVYFYAKPGDLEALRMVLEEYMEMENHENNLTELAGSKILKRLSNFVIDDEQLYGAPDGESRHQVSFSMGYDIFEGNLLTSKDYKVMIDGEAIKYISFRFEKSNMATPNTPNTTTGTAITGIDVVNSLGRLHEFSVVFDLFVDRNSAAILKILDDAQSITKINKTYEITIESLTDPVIFSFSRKMSANGFKISNTLPQISSIEVTMTPAYAKTSLSIGLVGGTMYDIPVLNYKFGHSAALKSAAYFGDNATKSIVIGLAKALVMVVPTMQDSPIILEFAKEVLSKVYTNKYQVQFQFLGITETWTLVMTESSIEGEDAAYDTLHLSFMEAR